MPCLNIPLRGDISILLVNSLLLTLFFVVYRRAIKDRSDGQTAIYVAYSRRARKIADQIFNIYTLQQCFYG
jgi:uncharacterized membrane protein YobD (UPF0266 family)